MKFDLDTVNCSVKVPKNILDSINKRFEQDVHHNGVLLNKDFLMYYVSTIYTKYYHKPQLVGKMVELYSVFTRKLLGPNYKQHIDWLVDNDYLECDNSYTVSRYGRRGKCKRYGIKDKYVQSHDFIIRDYIIGYKFLKKKIFDYKNDIVNQDTELLNEIRIMLSAFTFDSESAKTELKSIYDNKEISDKNYENELYKYNKLADKDLFISQDSYGRVHTNLTNIGKRSRKFITINGNLVSNVDIKASQPNFLYKVFEGYYKFLVEEYGYTCDNRYDTLVNGENGVPEHHATKDFVTDLSSELFRYKKMFDTDFYTRFLKMGKMFCGRAIFKKWFMNYMFGDFDNKLYLKIATVMKQHFPTLHEIVVSIKKQDYKMLAHALQREESNFIFKKVYPRIKEELNIPFATIHDSILVESCYKTQVSNIFSEELVKGGYPTRVDID